MTHASGSGDRMRQWQDRRSARLAARPGLHTDTRHGHPVRYLADELLVAAAEEQSARRVLATLGVDPARIKARPAGAGVLRMTAPGVDVVAATRAVRDQAGPGTAAPHHVFVSTPFEMGGPYGPPTGAAGYALPPGPAADAGVRITVVDTGIWRDTPLPADWYEATDADIDDTLDPDSDVGHANFIVGVVMSKTDNARVRVVKVLDADGVCTEADLAAALLALTDVDVVNLSLGGFSADDEPPLLLGAALGALLEGHDRVAVVAAGNEGNADRPYWPAAFTRADVPYAGQVLAVAAHDGTAICSWSNTGSWVSIAAPGADITSTYVTHGDFPTGFAQWSGTSFAAPYAAATIAAYHRTTRSVTAAVEQVHKEAAARTYGEYPGLA